jgi:pimeloyl-ACP methyl ester carboxylesterase
MKITIKKNMQLIIFVNKKKRTSQLANDVIDILDHLGWTSKVHLCGVSMGGMISLELVTSWPDRFKSVVLTSTTRGKQVPTVSIFIQIH